MGTPITEPRRNWAGNHTFGAARVHVPETVAQVQALVAGSSKVRALGSAHSFNDIADTTGDLLSLQRLNRVLTIDRESQTVTVEAGIRYGELCAALHEAGLAIHNTASLPHISVAGACATATHGSGDRNGCLATAVAALQLVTADGSLLNLARESDGDRFPGAVVGLGALGIVTQVTLNVSPTFHMRQLVYQDLPLAQMEASFDAITTSGYSVSLFTDWTGDRINQVWVKRRVTPDDTPETTDYFGTTRPTTRLHPIASLPAEGCTEQLDIPGPWHERLHHFRLEFTPASGAELQSEYFVPRRHALAAFRVVDAMRSQIVPLIQMSEVRTIAADDLWMSPFYRQDSVAFHFSWKLDWPGVSALLPVLEERLAPFDARPHWGKLYTTSPARLRDLYPRLPDFTALAGSLDPAHKFRNAYLARSIFPETAS